MKGKLYQILASKIDARIRCDDNGNSEWFERHEEAIRKLTNELPHGSGIDGENEIDLGKSTGEKIVIHTSFHHMNENGMYDGWTDHTLTVRPSLIHGFTMSISGPNRNDIKEYLYETFSYDLNREITK
jgi:hypothetical protein